MTTQLHSTLERYFTATNRHDVAGMIADFADDAVVKDEGHERHGVPAIGEWMKETIRKYNFKVEPTRVVREHDRTAVSATVSGDFPGSPIALTYWFTLVSQKIAREEHMGRCPTYAVVDERQRSPGECASGRNGSRAARKCSIASCALCNPAAGSCRSRSRGN